MPENGEIIFKSQNFSPISPAPLKFCNLLTEGDEGEEVGYFVSKKEIIKILLSQGNSSEIFS